MNYKTVHDLKGIVHDRLYKVLTSQSYTDLRPSQQKALAVGLLEGNNILVCTPTGSGKTLVAELAAVEAVYNKKGKAVYIVPLKSLAMEKYKQFTEKYSDIKIALSIGDPDSSDSYLERADIIITTSEKLDSLIRHTVPWLSHLAVVIVDEIHLLDEPTRGPTLEVVITILRHLLKKVQIIGLSATIGNPQELAAWLDAELVVDTWRPVELHHGVYLEDSIEFLEK